MPKYGNFKNRPVSRKMAHHRAKICLISTPLGVERNYKYATLGTFFKFQISCPNMELLKISTTATRGGKISLIWTPWGRKRVYMQPRELSSNSRFYAQIWKCWKPVCISKKAACRVKINSISALWGRKRVYVQLREQALCFLLSFMPKPACRSWICLQILFSSLNSVSTWTVHRRNYTVLYAEVGGGGGGGGSDPYCIC